MTAPVTPEASDRYPGGATGRAGTRATGAGAVRAVSSQSLLDGARELVIHHQGGQYHLRLTRNGKLILTK